MPAAREPLLTDGAEDPLQAAGWSERRLRNVRIAGFVLALFGFCVLAFSFWLQDRLHPHATPSPPPPSGGGSSDAAFGTAGDFDSFVLARFWDDKDAPGNLSLHGVWPQYNTYRGCSATPCTAAAGGHGWPQFCGKDQPAAWRALEPIVPTVRAEFAQRWRTYAPGYVENGGTFADHEWSKHGTCSAQTEDEDGHVEPGAAEELQRRYFTLQMQLMERYPLPNTVRTAASSGTAMTLAELQTAFTTGDNAGPANSVALSCDPIKDEPGAGKLTMVSFCLSPASWMNQSASLPARVGCSEETCLSSSYDNGCTAFPDKIYLDLDLRSIQVTS